jgi:hypothetical protein
MRHHHHRHHGRHYHDAARSIHHAHKAASQLSHMTSTLLDVAEVGGTTFAWGAVHGRYGVIAPMGVSLDLIVGVLASLVGMFDIGGDKIAPHLTNLGVGSLASFLNRKGVQLGTQWRGGAAISNPELPGHGIFGGEFARMHGGMPVPNAGAASISDQELAAMSAAARAR